MPAVPTPGATAPGVAATGTPNRGARRACRSMKSSTGADSSAVTTTRYASLGTSVNTASSAPLAPAARISSAQAITTARSPSSLSADAASSARSWAGAPTTTGAAPARNTRAVRSDPVAATIRTVPPVEAVNAFDTPIAASASATMTSAWVAPTSGSMRSSTCAHAAGMADQSAGKRWTTLWPRPMADGGADDCSSKGPRR